MKIDYTISHCHETAHEDREREREGEREREQTQSASETPERSQRENDAATPPSAAALRTVPVRPRRDLCPSAE